MPPEEVARTTFGGLDPSQIAKPANGNLTANRPSSSRSNQPSDDDDKLYRRSNDPHAIKVYSQLRKDGIRPPKWPSKPGDPANKAEMGRFREVYEEYRQKVRASLTKAKLIDDPNERRSLAQALPFRGICEDMCPDFEKVTRIAEGDIYGPEKNPQTRYPDARRMIKKLARSAAGQEAPLPMDIRSVPALQRTLDHLINEVLVKDENLQTQHGFIWDRTRAIRRDFTFFSSLLPEELKIQIYCLENITRFHVTAFHLIFKSEKKPEHFSDQQEMEQLGKALLSLRDLYDDCLNLGIECENEAEFRAYYLLFHGQDSNTLERLQRTWRKALWDDSDTIRSAMSLVESLQDAENYHGPLSLSPIGAVESEFTSFFRTVSGPEISYTMACFAELHFPHLRRVILTAIHAMCRPKGPTHDVTADVLNMYLQFDTIEEAVNFAEFHDLEVVPDETAPNDVGKRVVKLSARAELSYPRLKHQFSQDLVERKRSGKSLPTLIHETIFEQNISEPESPVLAFEPSLFKMSSPESVTSPLPGEPPREPRVAASWKSFPKVNPFPSIDKVFQSETQASGTAFPTSQYPTHY